VSTLSLRRASDDDLERLVEIHAACYPSDASFERRKRGFTHPTLGDFGSVRVALREGRIVAHAKLFEVAMWIGGAQVRTGAIGSVAVAPEARRVGIGRWLVAQLHAELDRRGAALSLLYPFRERFYAELGYGTTLPMLTLSVGTRAVARAFPCEAADASFEVVAMEGRWLDNARDLYSDVARMGAGRFVRSEASWLRVLANDARHVLGVVSRSDRTLQGYVVFTHEMPSLHGVQTLVIHEITARGAAARGALLALIGRQSDQAEVVEMTLPWGDPLVFAFHDAAGPRRGSPAVTHPIGQIGAGPMVNLIDARRALEQRGYESDGELTLRCTGEPAALRLTVRAGRGEVTELPPGSACEIEVPRPILASLVASGIRPGEAAEVSALLGGSAAIRQAEAIFSGARFEALDAF
jgi:predicted acetyltransferase